MAKKTESKIEGIINLTGEAVRIMMKERIITIPPQGMKETYASKSKIVGFRGVKIYQNDLDAKLRNDPNKSLIIMKGGKTPRVVYKDSKGYYHTLGVWNKKDKAGTYISHLFAQDDVMVDDLRGRPWGSMEEPTTTTSPSGAQEGIDEVTIVPKGQTLVIGPIKIPISYE